MRRLSQLFVRIPRKIAHFMNVDNYVDNSVEKCKRNAKKRFRRIKGYLNE